MTMRTTKILDMLNDGKIEELRAALMDEIFTETLKGKPNARKRYMAMKKYLAYTSNAREILKKPCEIEFEGDKYLSFCNSYSLALTTEGCGEIAMCDEQDRYPDVSRIIHFEGEERLIDFNRVIAEAKSKGYKLTKNEMMGNNYLMEYDGAYFRIALIDITYGILNDGGEARVFHVSGSRRPIAFKNDIGLGVIMPVHFEGEPEEGMTIIKVE